MQVEVVRVMKKGFFTKRCGLFELSAPYIQGSEFHGKEGGLGVGQKGRLVFFDGFCDVSVEGVPDTERVMISGLDGGRPERVSRRGASPGLRKARMP